MSNTITENPILEYAAEINCGNIVACQKIKLTMKHLCDVVNGKYPYMYYNPQRAQHAIDFLQNYCTHIKGKLGGKPLQLMLWQKAIIAATFGILDVKTNLRHYRKLAIIVAKKNGKSLLSSGIGLYMLTADGEHGAEVYSVATKREQAKIVWDTAVSMVRKSKALRKRCKDRVGYIGYGDSKFVPLSSDYGTLDGLNVHCALLDEVHQWRNGQKLYDIIVDGTVNREQPLTVVTSTMGYVRNDLFDSEYQDYANTINKYVTCDPTLYDDTVLPFIYELDDETEIVDEKNWVKANPGLGTIKNVENLRTKVKNAKTKKSELKNVLCKDFNVVQTNSSSYMSYNQCRNTATFDIEALKPDYFVAGVDLAQTTDLTSAKAIFTIPNDPNIYVISKYWIPKKKVQYHVDNDHQPYDVWVAQGLIDVCDSDRVDYKAITQWFLDLQDMYDMRLFKCGYDRYSVDYWLSDMQATFGKDVMVPVAQGPITLSEPMELLYDLFNEHRIIYNDNAIDLWCFCNVVAITDSNGLSKPCKKLKVERIDGYASLLDAYVAYLNNQEEYEMLQDYSRD